MVTLKKTRWKVENETGLVVIGDPKLAKHIENTTSGTYGGTSNEINPDVYNDGVDHGLNVQLRKPIKATKEDYGLQLEARKK